VRLGNVPTGSLEEVEKTSQLVDHQPSEFLMKTDYLSQ